MRHVATRFRSGPFAGHRRLLSIGPPTYRPMGHRALPRLQLLRAHLTPRSASVRFSHALMALLPLPGLFRRSLSLTFVSRSHGRNSGRYEVSPGHMVGVVRASPPESPAPIPGPCCGARFLVADRGPRLRVFMATSPPVPALHGFTARSGLLLRLGSLRTSPRGDALSLGYSTKTAKR